MKKIILTTALLVFVLIAKAQVITGSKWIIAEYGISDDIRYGIDKKIKPLFVFYNKDSTNNKIDYSKIEMHFFTDGKYLAKNAIGAVYNGTWQLNGTKDSLTTDSIKYKFDFIDPSHCITNNMNTQIIDTLGTIDTTYSYIIMYGIPDITVIKDVNTDSYNVEIYPNPATSEIILHFNNQFTEKEVMFNIYNTVGQSLLERKITNTDKDIRYDISSLPPGVYHICFIDKIGKPLFNKKFIVITR